MKLIVGLGNPGLKYKNTRHNLGATAVEAVAKEYKTKLKLKRSLKNRIGGIDIFGSQCLLAIPHSFMNLSGEAVDLLLDVENISIQDLLVIYDDMDLDLGQLRFRKRGSSGGHKGIDSLMETLNSQEFDRLKLGIGRASPKVEASDYVLSHFSKKEVAVIKPLTSKVIKACEIWVKYGIDDVMNEFN